MVVDVLTECVRYIICHLELKNMSAVWNFEVITENLTKRETVDLLNLLATDFFFQILAHPVFKM